MPIESFSWRIATFSDMSVSWKCVEIINPRRFSFVLARTQHAPAHEERADHDGAIGQIEIRVMVAAKVERKEVHHAPDADAVRQIAHRAAAYQRHSHARERPYPLAPQQNGEHDHRASREDAEGEAGVFGGSE